MNDEAAMTLALAEAVKGVGRTHPNPAVGAVIVKGNRIIACGFHSRAGEPHAEAVALARAGARARGATLYSTLEPCSHHGRTPPCSEAIIAAGVARVVFASSDPNPLVNGKGLKKLRRAGVMVTPHVLRDAADALNRPFFKVMRRGLPWVTLKAAVTLDGKIATQTGDSKWVSGEASRRMVHQLRNAVDAVVVGASTVVADDPDLTTRLSQATSETRNAMRVVIDPSLRTNFRSRVYDTSIARTAVATQLSPHSDRARALAKRGVEVWQLPHRKGVLSLPALMKRMVAEGLLHVLVEGGATVHGHFLKAGLADEVLLFVAPKLFGAEGLTWSGALGVSQPALAPQFIVEDAVTVGTDVLIRLRTG